MFIEHWGHMIFSGDAPRGTANIGFRLRISSFGRHCQQPINEKIPCGRKVCLYLLVTNSDIGHSTGKLVKDFAFHVLSVANAESRYLFVIYFLPP